MSDSSQRAAQRRRIQQLHERLELYNFADSSADPASTAASGPSFAGGRGLQAGLGGRAPAAAATKPSRAAPVFSSPDPTAPPPATTNAPEVFSVSSSHQTQPAGTGTSTAAAAGRTDWLRASQAPLQPRATMAAPAPAPQLARNLAHEFGGTSASPTRASPPPPPPPPPAAAFGSPTTGLGRGPSAPAPPATAAAASAAGGAAGASRRASDVFRYFEGGESDDSEYMEYDVEEVEEYTDEEEEEEEESDAEGDGESDVVGAEEDAEHVRDAHTRSLEQMLHRLYRACSTSPHHAAKSPPSPAAASAAAAALPARDRSVGSAAPPRAASVGATADTANLFLQQAAEVYRQRHRYRAAHAPSPHDSPHSSRDAWTTGEESSEADTSTSEPTEELDDGATSRSCSSAAAAPAATTLVEGAAETTPAAAAALESLPTAANATGDGDGLPSAAVCFDQLETAYRRLLVLQQGVLYVSERAGPKSFPAPLPHQEEACALAQQRDAAARRDAELRAAPPSGATLEDLRQRESAAVDESLAALHVRFTAATSSLTRVTHRESLVEGKRRLLKQRELEVAKQREARLIIERDCAETERRHSERAEQLQRMEAGYSARLQQHDQQQKAAQEQIGEVEQLSKQVSAWLGILEERDRRLGRKESRLQRVQDDLLRRTEDVTMWKKATQRVKQIPPPPSPPRIR
ncbi:hypothetical protein NESM_000121200 [Novymonas esmeraldas]|uniref:Uncharacterized protein n=1 Tax=Novymonas esmeraldas TaxID=1808958 RepID=A0AAW0F3A4_9TRYP